MRHPLTCNTVTKGNLAARVMMLTIRAPLLLLCAFVAAVVLFPRGTRQQRRRRPRVRERERDSMKGGERKRDAWRERECKLRCMCDNFFDRAIDPPNPTPARTHSNSHKGRSSSWRTLNHTPGIPSGNTDRERSRERRQGSRRSGGVSERAALNRCHRLRTQMAGDQNHSCAVIWLILSYSLSLPREFADADLSFSLSLSQQRREEKQLCR